MFGRPALAQVFLSAVLAGGAILAGGGARSSSIGLVAPVAAQTLAGGRATHFGTLPMGFEVNRGQADSRVRYLARGQGFGLFLTGHEAVLALSGRGTSARRAVVRLRAIGAATSPTVTGMQQLPGRVNYLHGNDPHRWVTNIPSYARVQYRSVYPHIDLAYYGHRGHLEYDWIVLPGGDLRSVRLALSGTTSLRLTARGDLLLGTTMGIVRQLRPVVYQPGGHHLAVHYVLHGTHLGFSVGAYDHRKPLIVDPVLNYSSYLGGTLADGSGNALAVDSGGAAYIAGSAADLDFPTTPGVVQPANKGLSDAFVVKLNAAGTAAVYSTYLGGGGDDAALGLALDGAHDVFLTGQTTSTDFPACPTNSSPAEGRCSGAGAPLRATSGGGTDAFVAKLAPAGDKLMYSTYLGGSSIDIGYGVAVDTVGNATVAGATYSANFPTLHPAQSFVGGEDAFVTRLNPAGTGLIYSTLLGGGGIVGSDFSSAHSLAVSPAGNAYVTGSTNSVQFPACPATVATPPCASTGTPLNSGGSGNDAFVTELAFAPATGILSLPFSARLGGSDDDAGAGIALDGNANVYLTGSTGSTNFPHTTGVFQPALRANIDAFVSKLSPAGTSLLYSTYLGGTGNEQGNGLAVDSGGTAYVAGSTNSSDFPVCQAIAPTPCATTGGAIQPGNAGGNDAFYAKIAPGGVSLAYSTYLGGSADDAANGIALGAPTGVILVGATASSASSTGSGSTAFPTCPGITPPCASSGTPRQGPGTNGGDAFVSQIPDGIQATAARVASLAVRRTGRHVVFQWRMTVTTGVSGFDLYEGAHRLNSHTVRVHRGLVYHYAARSTGHGQGWSWKVYGYNLRVLLNDGRQLVVPARPHA